MSEPEAPTVACASGCGTRILVSELESAGWDYLPIQNRYRCTACWRALREVNQPKQEEP
jgi:DNA-directed RNA polymerase subunit RPC12/RpoP